MTTQLSPWVPFRAWDNNGNPLVGGQLFTYIAGTSTPQATYTDSTGATPNANPVVLNSRGEANVWLGYTQPYKFVLTDSNGVQIWSQDNIAGSPLGTVNANGTWLFNANNNYPAATFTGGASNSVSTYVVQFIQSANTGLSGGAYIQAGTNPSDYALNVSNAAATQTLFQVRGNGQLVGGTAANGLWDMTPEGGSFTGTLTGFASGIPVACSWVRIGSLVMLTVNSNALANTGTSNSTSMTMTGIPVAIAPSITQYGPFGFLTDNGTNAGGNSFGISTSQIVFLKGTSASATSWTATGTKGIQTTCTIPYRL